MFVKIDFTNAFNTLRRDVHTPGHRTLFARAASVRVDFVQQGQRSAVWDYSLQSQEGAQQGDPLGPLYFCLAVHDLLTSLQSPIVVGHLVDMSMGGEAGMMAEDFSRLESGAAARPHT